MSGYDIANKEGFTLIEMIVSIVLIAIFASAAALGLVQIMKGYTLTRQNTQLIQRAQIAMTRIAKELNAVQGPLACTTCGITTAGASSVAYTRWASFSDSTAVTNTISLSGSTLQIGSNKLIENVTGLTFAYYDASGNSNPSSTANIRRVDVSLTVNGTTFNNSTNVMAAE